MNIPREEVLGPYLLAQEALGMPEDGLMSLPPIFISSTSGVFLPNPTLNGWVMREPYLDDLLQPGLDRSLRRRGVVLLRNRDRAVCMLG
jgi:hypothetical protein